MKLEFGYGNRTETVVVPDHALRETLLPNAVPHERTGRSAVEYALSHPIGSKRLSEIVSPGETVAIVTSDVSRPFPSYMVLPPVLRELFSAGIRQEDVTVVFALGSHRHHTEEEKAALVGEEVYKTVRTVDSDPDDCVRLGMTKRGTPVDITRSVAEADRIIALGNIEFHYFAGYSGGAKALMPGVSSMEAIEANHRMMVLPEACAGSLDENPLRQDIEEAGEMAGIDFIVNVVLDEHKKIVFAAAGDKVLAHRAGCRYLDRMYRKTIAEKADIVLVSQGGSPKDANLYQTQKALENAKYAVKNGGSVILIGACAEGLGSKKFEEWLTGASSPDELVERIGRKFELGGHKAAAIGLVLQKAKIYLVSEMDREFVKSIFFLPASSAQEAFDRAFSEYGPDATVIAMPYGGSTLPSPVTP